MPDPKVGKWYWYLKEPAPVYVTSVDPNAERAWYVQMTVTENLVGFQCAHCKYDDLRRIMAVPIQAMLDDA